MAVSPEILPSSLNLLCAEDADDVASWEMDDVEETGTATAAAADDDDDEARWSAPFLIDDRTAEAALLAAESGQMARPDYLVRILAGAVDAAARLNAIVWILKVNEFYGFRPVTAWLSVHYVDRFLSEHTLPNGKGGWPLQLLSVACLSVAAKMEETHVPLLLDLQILDPPFVFDTRTIRRMELLLAAALHWRLRAVTPFDFLHQLASLRAVAALPSSPAALFSRATHLILSTCSVVDFLGYRPSAIAAAAFLYAADEITDSSAGYAGDLSNCINTWVRKEVVSRCRQLMEQHLIDMCPFSRREKRKTVDESRGRRPRSARNLVGELDSAACGCSDTGTRSDGQAENDAARTAKRRRLGEHPCTGGVFTTDLDGEIL